MKKLRNVLYGIVTLLFLPMALLAGQESDKLVRLESLDVSDNVYLLRGGGTNILAFIAEDGVVLIDTLGAGWGKATRRALDNLTSLPVTTIINTHAHTGHSGGNGEFPLVTEIIAHEKTKAQMRKMPAFQDENVRLLPTRTFEEKLTLLEGFDRIELHYFGPAHTDGDILVVFPEKGIAYLGDLFGRMSLPRIDRDFGGSGLAYPLVLARALDEIKYFPAFVRGPEVRTFDRVVPGHVLPPAQTPLLRWLKWDDFKRYAEFVTNAVEVVREAKSRGRTEDQIIDLVKDSIAVEFPSYQLDGVGAFIETVSLEITE